MDIKLFDTSIEELSEKLVGTQWVDRHGDTRTVMNVFVDGWNGGYCVRWNDGTWNRVRNVLEYGSQVQAVAA